MQYQTQDNGQDVPAYGSDLPPEGVTSTRRTQLGSDQRKHAHWREVHHPDDQLHHHLIEAIEKPGYGITLFTNSGQGDTKQDAEHNDG